MTPIRLLGPFPPPYGGVAIHLVRLLEALRERGVDMDGVSQGGVPEGVDGIRRMDPMDMFRRSPVHYHTDEGNARWMMLLGLTWQRLGVPYVVTVHSFRDRHEFAQTTWVRRLYKAYQGARAVIAISEEVRSDLVQRLGLDPSSITVIGSDLPISTWERSAPLSPALPEQWRNAPVRILANAGRLVRYEGEDLYGLDLVAEAVAGLDTDVATALILGEVVEPDILRPIEQAAARNPRLFLVRDHSGPLLPAVQHADIIVRPTRTEGGRSLTLSEAIELGRWAIGSDSVPRPDGTMVFRNGDAADLRRALEEACGSVRNGTYPKPTSGNTELVDELLDVYRRSFSLNVSR